MSDVDEWAYRQPQRHGTDDPEELELAMTAAHFGAALSQDAAAGAPEDEERDRGLQ